MRGWPHLLGRAVGSQPRLSLAVCPVGYCASFGSSHSRPLSAAFFLIVTRSLFAASCLLHARAVRPRRPWCCGPGVRRVRGRLFGNPGPVPPGPGSAGCASLGTPSGSMRPCPGPWAASRHPRAAFSAPVPLDPTAAPRALPSAADPVTPDDPAPSARDLRRAPPLATPVAASGRPVAGKDTRSLPQPEYPGDKDRRAPCAHGESVIPELRAAQYPGPRSRRHARRSSPWVPALALRSGRHDSLPPVTLNPHPSSPEAEALRRGCRGPAARLARACGLPLSAALGGNDAGYKARHRQTMVIPAPGECAGTRHAELPSTRLRLLKMHYPEQRVGGIWFAFRRMTKPSTRCFRVPTPLGYCRSKAARRCRCCRA